MSSHASVDSLKKLRSHLKDKTLNDIGEMLGISGSHLSSCLSEKTVTSKTISLAAKAVLNTLGIGAAKVVVCCVPTEHWNTVSTLISNLEGDVVVEMNALLADEKYDPLDRNIVIFHIAALHEKAVTTLITTLGGEIKKVAS